MPKGKKATSVPESSAPPSKPAGTGEQDRPVAIADDEVLQRPPTFSPSVLQPSLTFEIPEKEISVPWFSDPFEAGLGDDVGRHGVLERLSSQTSDLLSETQTIVTPSLELDDIFTLDPLASTLANDEDEVEEVVRFSPLDDSCEWDEVATPLIPDPEGSFEPPICPRLGFSSGSPEMLLMRFDRRTCGILSVKDGSTENPWRTLVWPLATNSPALYHAICSLAAFHWSKAEPQLRVRGMDHMRQSVRILAMNLRDMRPDAALATTLALAFAESWDRHVSSGIQHLQGAKALVSRALAFQQRNAPERHDIPRLRFLYNAWVYVSVIARLTSIENVGCGELSVPFSCEPPSQVHEIDPLMGCATTLFPLIGRVADLVRKIRTTATNSVAIISQAIELKALIEQWEPPKYFEPPEDPTSNVQHSYQTAQAYRWATLLHLHQAVPEIPSESAAVLAKRVLILLATVPPSSRTTVIHIYPLLVASCEVEGEEDRDWVRARWASMQSRLMIGNIDRCLEVINEVWARRDEHTLANLADLSAPFVNPMDTMRRRNTADLDGMLLTPPSELEETPFWGLPDPKPRRFSADDIDIFDPESWAPMAITPVKTMDSNNMEYEKSVRGRLHWAGVMRDWNWEVLLG